jgi:hypothetical protein
VRRDLGMAWGVKTSLLSYLGALPDTRIELGPGSGQLLDGRFYFSVDPSVTTSSEEEARASTYRFRGAVRFRAHAGMLDVTVSDPHLEDVGEGTWAMSIATWRGGEWVRTRFVTCRLIEPTPQDSEVISLRFTAALADGAQELFDETYAVGEPFDDVELRVPAI